MSIEKKTKFALALKEADLKPLEFCRAITSLTGLKYSPTMPSRWISGMHEAPPPALALAELLGRLPEEQRKDLCAGPPRKTYMRKNT